MQEGKEAEQIQQVVAEEEQTVARQGAETAALKGKQHGSAHDPPVTMSAAG